MSAMNPQFQLMLQQAIVAFQGGHFDRADSILKKVLQADSKNLTALHLLGLIKASQANFREAADFLEKACHINPNDASIRYNLARALSDCGLDKESSIHYKKAVVLAPNNPDACLNYANVLFKLGCYGEAIVHYDSVINLVPNDAQAYFNKGGVLYELRRYDEAITQYDKAINLNSDDAHTYSNKGNALNKLARYDEAIAQYDKAINLNFDNAKFHSNKGNALNKLARYDEAIAHYNKAISLNSDLDWIYGDLLHIKMKACNWSSFASYFESISKKLLENQKVIVPFQFLAVTDDGFLNKKCSEIYAEDKFPTNSILEPIQNYPNNNKIRLGYYSPDFKTHPVALLTSELFEIHDRNRFEVFAFSFKNSVDNDDMNQRLRKAFDGFINVENMLDVEIAQLTRKLGINIAIDLSGHTLDSRTGIFSYRAAPIQVNWLGYAGTIGASYIDYIVADKTTIPESHQSFYTEKVVYMPDTYMVDDSSRIASSKTLEKRHFGIPDNSFVFCCFNADYKFNPDILNTWSRILLSVANSVLWIPENNKYFKSNITAEFQTRGIDPSRVIFSQKVDSMADHLARYHLADLFLDTYPYNAHSTALDSLKTGTPLITLIGQSFASRVAASLLNAIGLPELITNTQEEYEALAIKLAKNPQRLADIKSKLVNNRLTTPLFDTPLFAENLEAAYIKMMERYQADLQPDHIFID
jgi:predicted O-linked N-acetylglucosamine transferase (SPINDLY family)